MANFTTSKVDGNTVAAAEWNQLADIDNAITTGGQTPSTGDLNQLGKSMAAYAAQGGFFGTDSGAADAYVITAISPFMDPETLKDGMTVKFRPANAGTGAATVNPFGLTVKSIKQADGSTDPTPGQITTAADLELRYDGTVFRISNVVTATTTVAGIVELLTDSELATGTDTSRAATAASLLSLFGTSSQAASGYVRIPINIGGAFDEVIFQWGVDTLTDTSGQTITFPVTFPNSCLRALGMETGADDAVANLVYSGLSTTQITGINPSSAGDFSWLAIGY